MSSIVLTRGLLDRYAVTRSNELQTYEGRLYMDWGGGSSGKRAWIQRRSSE